VVKQEPAKIDNPFEGTVCATPEEVQYFNATVPALKGKKFKAQRVFKASTDGQNAADFHKKAVGLAPTVTFGWLANKLTVAAFTSIPWKNEGNWVKDSTAMLLNLTDKYAVKARDDDYRGIVCHSTLGPSFGLNELVAIEPFLGEGNLRSDVDYSGYKIPRNDDDINPITGGKLNGRISRETLLELEVWHINFLP